MNNNNLKHEDDMENAKEILYKGVGMFEIPNLTGLDEKNMKKHRRNTEYKD